MELDAPCADREPAFVRGRGACRRVGRVVAPEAHGHDAGFVLARCGGHGTGRWRRCPCRIRGGGGRGGGVVVGCGAASGQQRAKGNGVEAHAVLSWRDRGGYGCPSRVRAWSTALAPPTRSEERSGGE